MGKGSKRRPTDKKKVSKNWPFKDPERAINNLHSEAIEPICFEHYGEPV